MVIEQYVIYKRQPEGFYSLAYADHQKNLLVLVFLLQDTGFRGSTFIEDIKNIKNIRNMSFNASRVYYDESNNAVEIDENIGFEDNEDYSTFITKPQAMISIVERWRSARLQLKNFILMTLDEDNYVNFVTLDAPREVDEYIKMYYQGDDSDVVS